jgi:hypothetical protein
VPWGRDKVVLEVSRGLRDRIRELAEERGLPYEDLIWEALDALARSGGVRRTQSGARSSGGVPAAQSITRSATGAATQSGKPAQGGPVQVARLPGDPLWYLIRVGEGFHAAEVALNTVQLAKLCNAGLLAEEVCEKARKLK